MKTMPQHSERGTTLVEVLVALIVLSIGIAASARVFPSITRSQLQARMLTAGSCYAREKAEEVSVLPWSHPDLTDGRHPPGTATENLGANGSWHRHYEVTTLTGTLSDLKKVTVTVSWEFQGSRSTTTTTYIRK